MTRTEERLRSTLHAWADAVEASSATYDDWAHEPQERPGHRRVVVAASAAVLVAVVVAVGLVVASVNRSTHPPAGGLNRTPTPSPRLESFAQQPTSPLAEIAPNTYFFWSGGHTCEVVVYGSGKESFSECAGTHAIDVSKAIVDVDGGNDINSDARTPFAAILVNHSVARVDAIFTDGTRHAIALRSDPRYETSIGILVGIDYSNVKTWIAYNASGRIIASSSPSRQDDPSTSSDVELRPVVATWPNDMCEGRTAPSGTLLTTDKHTCYALGAPFSSPLAALHASVVSDTGQASLRISFDSEVVDAIGRMSSIAVTSGGMVMGTSDTCANREPLSACT